jgi:hypothetical protein
LKHRKNRENRHGTQDDSGTNVKNCNGSLQEILSRTLSAKNSLYFSTSMVIVRYISYKTSFATAEALCSGARWA